MKSKIISTSTFSVYILLGGLAAKFVLAQDQNSLRPNHSLQITHAVCGANDSWKDVTGILQGMVQGDALNVDISQPFREFGGDPASGRVKTLTIEYAYEGKAEKLTLQEQFPIAFQLRLPTDKSNTPEVPNSPVTPVQAPIPQTSKAIPLEPQHPPSLQVFHNQTEHDETNLTLTVSGVTYSNVVFMRSNPYAVTIRHSTGIASVPLAQLPPDLQQRFGYDPNRAADYYQKSKVQEMEAQPRDRLAFDTINFGDSREVVEQKLLNSKKLSTKNSPEYRALMDTDSMTLIDMDGGYQLDIGEDSYKLFFLFIDGKLSSLKLANPVRDASFYDTDVRRAWQSIREVAIARFGRPTISKGYPELSQMQNGYSVNSDEWKLKGKDVTLGIVEENATFYAMLSLTDQQLAAQERMREENDSNADKKSAIEGF